MSHRSGTDAVDLDPPADDPRVVRADPVPAGHVPAGSRAAASWSWPDGAPGWVRGPLGALAAAALAATAAGLAVHHRSTALAEAADAERDRRAVVLVAASGDLLGYRPPSSDDYNTTATLALDVANAGPLPLRLVDVRLDGAGRLLLDDLAGEVEVAPARAVRVLLAGPVRCGRGGAARAGDPVVTVRTSDGELREVVLAAPVTPSWAGGLARACSPDGSA